MLRVDPTNADVVYSRRLVDHEVDATAARRGRACAARRAAMTTRTCGSVRNDPRIIALVSDQGALVTREWRRDLELAGSTSRPRSSTTSASPPTFPYRVCARAAGERLGVHREPRQRRRDDDARLASGRSDRVRLRGARSARSDMIYGAGRNEVSQVPLVHRPGAERDADPGARPRRARRPHPARHVLAARSARAVLRRQPAVPHPRRRPELGSRSAPIWRVRPGGARERRRAASQGRREAARRDLRARSPRPRPSTRSGPAPTTGWCGSPATAGRHWRDVTPPGLTPWSKVTQIEASHFDADTRLRVGEPPAHRRSASLHLPHARRRQSLAGDRAGLPDGCAGECGARGSGARRDCCLPRPRRRCGCRSTRATLGVAAAESAAHLHARPVDPRRTT